jgi:hypothetical protein
MAVFGVTTTCSIVLVAQALPFHVRCDDNADHYYCHYGNGAADATWPVLADLHVTIAIKFCHLRW